MVVDRQTERQTDRSQKDRQTDRQSLLQRSFDPKNIFGFGATWMFYYSLKNGFKHTGHVLFKVFIIHFEINKFLITYKLMVIMLIFFTPVRQQLSIIHFFFFLFFKDQDASCIIPLILYKRDTRYIYIYVLIFFSCIDSRNLKKKIVRGYLKTQISILLL